MMFHSARSVSNRRRSIRRLDSLETQFTVRVSPLAQGIRVDLRENSAGQATFAAGGRPRRGRGRLDFRNQSASAVKILWR